VSMLERLLVVMKDKMMVREMVILSHQKWEINWEIQMVSVGDEVGIIEGEDDGEIVGDIEGNTAGSLHSK